MRQGFWLLWILSLGVSGVAWLYLKISRAQNWRFRTRRPITGCELARQILDRNHFHRTSVNPASKREDGETVLRADQLVLAGNVYYGNRLTDLVQALRATVSYLEAPHSFLPNDLGPAGARGRVFGMGLFLSWCLILAGILWGHWSGLISMGQFLFISFFFFALSSLGKEWEIVQRAISEMGGVELGTDERVRMKRLLKAMRWAPLAELFRLPFERWPIKT